MQAIFLCLLAMVLAVQCQKPSLKVSFDKSQRRPRRVVGYPYEFAILPPSVTVNEGHLDADESVEGEAMIFNGDYHLQARDGGEILDNPGCLTDWEQCKKGATILAFINPDNPFTANSVQETLFRFGDSKDADSSFGLTVSISRKKIYVWADGEESHAKLECSPHDVQGPEIIAMGWFLLAVRIQPRDNGDTPRASAIKLLINANLMDCEVKEPQVNIAPSDRRANTIYIAGDNPARLPQFGPYFGTMDHFQFFTKDLGIPGVRDIYRQYKDILDALNMINILKKSNLLD